MGKKRNPPKEKKPEPVLMFDQGFWWIVAGTKRLNVGRNKKYAEKVLAETLNA